LKSVDHAEDAATSTNDSEAFQVYSRRVEEVFKSMPLMSFARSSSFSTMSPAKKRKIDDAKSSVESLSSPWKRTATELQTDLTQQLSVSEDSPLELRDLTPPPTPKSAEKKHRKGLKRAVRTAVTRLQKVQKYLDSSADNDSDVRLP